MDVDGWWASKMIVGYLIQHVETCDMNGAAT